MPVSTVFQAKLGTGANLSRLTISYSTSSPDDYDNRIRFTMIAAYREDFLPVSCSIFDDDAETTIAKVSWVTTTPPRRRRTTSRPQLPQESDDDYSSSFRDVKLLDLIDTPGAIGSSTTDSSHCSYLVTHEFNDRFRNGIGLPSLLTTSFLQEDDRTDEIVVSRAVNLSRESINNKTDTLLPSYFVPGPYSVLIGRGKECKGAIGNQRLKVLASTFLSGYSNALNKAAKTKIVAKVVSMIREACPLGAFIRLGKDGRWYEVKEAVATEKVGYTMRELLGEQYKSSSKSKALVRRYQAHDERSCSSSSSRISESLLSSSSNQSKRCQQASDQETKR